MLEVASRRGFLSSDDHSRLKGTIAELIVHSGGVYCRKPECPLTRELLPWNAASELGLLMMASLVVRRYWMPRFGDVRSKRVRQAESLALGNENEKTPPGASTICRE